MVIKKKISKARKKPKDYDAFNAAFGMWKTKETGVEYTRRIRAEWEKRLKRIYKVRHS